MSPEGSKENKPLNHFQILPTASPTNPNRLNGLSGSPNPNRPITQLIAASIGIVINPNRLATPPVKPFHND